MHHPFLDLMMSQFRLLLAEAQENVLPSADVEMLSLDSPASGAAGMWVREEMLSWLAVRGYPELMPVASLNPILAKLRYSGNIPRLQGFLVAKARLLLLAGAVADAEACLQEAVLLWHETGGAAGFVLFPHGETALLRVLAPRAPYAGDADAVQPGCAGGRVCHGYNGRNSGNNGDRFNKGSSRNKANR